MAIFSRNPDIIADSIVIDETGGYLIWLYESSMLSNTLTVRGQSAHLKQIHGISVTLYAADACDWACVYDRVMQLDMVWTESQT